MAEDIGSLAVKLALDDAPFREGMQNLKRSLQVIDSSFKESIAGVKNWGTNISSLKSQIESLGQKMTVQKNIIKMYTEQLDKAKNSLQQNAQKMMELKGKVDSAESAWKQSANALGKNAQKTKDLKAEYDKLKKELEEQEARVRTSAKAVDNYTTKVNQANARLKNMKSELNEINRNLAIQESQFIKTGKSMDKIGQGTKNLGSGLSNFGSSFTTYVSTPLLGLGVGIAKIGNEFDAQMSRVQAISQASGQDFTDLRNLALKLGADTSFSAKQAAEGMEMFASAGFSTKEIIQGMPGMLSLAASSGVDIATASDIAASSLRAFGLNASEAGHVADVLAKASADTGATIEGLGFAMKYVAPSANALGLSLEETAAAIGVLSDAGIKGETAGTTLRSALVSLVDPKSDAAAALLKNLGVNAFDSTGKMKPLATVIGDIRTATANMTKEQKAQAMSTIFGTEALSGMMAMLDAQPGRLESLTESFKKSSGAADEMAKTMKGNQAGAIEALKGSLETLAIRLNDVMKGPITEVIVKITNFINKLSQLDDTTLQTIVKIAGFAIVFGPLVMVFGKVTESAGTLISAIGLISQGIGNFKANSVANVNSFGSKVKEGMASAGKSFLEFQDKPNIVSRSMKGVSTTVNGHMLNIKSSVANGMMGVKQTFLNGFASLPMMVQRPLGAVGTAVGSVAPKFTAVGGAALTGLKTMMGAAMSLVGPAAIVGLLLVGLGVAEQKMGPQLDAIMNKIINEGPQMINKFVAGLVAKIPALIQAGTKLLMQLLQALTANVPAILSGATQIIVTLVQGVAQSVPMIIPGIIQFLQVFLQAIIQNLPIILQAGLTILIALIKGVVDNIEMITNAIVQLLIMLVQVIAQNLPIIIDAGIQIFTAICKGIGIAMPLLMQAIPQLLYAIGQAFFSVNWMSIGWNIIQGIGQGIASAGGGLFQSLKNLAAGALQAAKNFLGINSPSKVFSDIVGRAIPEGIAVGIENNTPKVTSQLGQLTKDMTVSPEVQAKMNASLGTITGNAQGVTSSQPNQQPVPMQGGTQTIVVPVNLDGRVIAEVVAENQKYMDRYNNRVVGGVGSW